MDLQGVDLFVVFKLVGINFEVEVVIESVKDINFKDVGLFENIKLEDLVVFFRILFWVVLLVIDLIEIILMVI